MNKSPFRILLALITVSCTGDGGRTGGSRDSRSGVLSVDTLANGAVHVVSKPEGVWADAGTEPWQLTEDLRIGVIEGDDHYMFGNVAGLIPTPDGRIWVLDGMAHELRLYDQDGAFVRAVGRDGEGPGEFGFNPCGFPGPNGEIWVEAGGRWQWFSPEGDLLGGQPVTRHLGCGIRSWLPDGRFLAVESVFGPGAQEPRSFFLLHDREPSGEVVVVDTVFSPTFPDPPRVEWQDDQGRSRMSLYMPFVHLAGRTLGPNGDYWISEGGGEYRIRRQTIFGDTLVIMERPYEPIPIPDPIRREGMPERERNGLRLDPGFDPDDVPRVFPPFDRLIPGTDGTLWALRRLEGGAYGFDVFARDGRFLGPVSTPPGFDRVIVYLITADHMYGRAIDELDVQYVVRLAIRKPEA